MDPFPPFARFFPLGSKNLSETWAHPHRIALQTPSSVEILEEKSYAIGS